MARFQTGEDGLRILLIGASGFIGSSVAGRLRAVGHEVVAVVRRRGAIL